MRILILFVSCLLPVIARAEVIDRVAVSLGNSVIAESEVLRQIRIAALLNGVEPDFSAASKRETAERLVEQELIRREIALSQYIPNSVQKSDALYKIFRKRFPSEQDYQQALKKHQLTDAEIRAAFEWQATFLDFVDIRFRPGIQVPEEEMRRYYEEEIKPKNTPDATVSYEEARPKIEEILTQKLVDNALDRWLGQSRTQTRIRYRREALQ